MSGIDRYCCYERRNKDFVFVASFSSEIQAGAWVKNSGERLAIDSQTMQPVEKWTPAVL
jgi:hypothetical protein